ncbi:MAG TPA: zinc ribbon domain-containing protein [Anaerolineales bacterium]|nr:zinc ribbon domain-containing protein [Anaerolineales bacterium]
MDIAALFFTLAILVLVAMYLYAPLAQRFARPVTHEEHELSALMAERDRIINALQELDFDFKLGKIPDEDYPAQRTNLLQKGADVLRKIDNLTPAQDAKQEEPKRSRKSAHRQTQLRETAVSTGESVEDRLEQAIAARRADASTNRREPIDDEVESMISARRMKRKDKSAGFCPKCGKPVLLSDRFCPSCGKALT